MKPTKDFKPRSVRNYIIQSFLKNYKSSEPQFFWPNAKYYGKYEPEIKAVLDSPDSTIIVSSKNEGTVPHGGPFTLENEDIVYGWALGSLKDEIPCIYSLYVTKDKRRQSYGRRMIELLYTHLKKPPKVQLVYPTRQTFNAVKTILWGRCRVYVDLES